MSKVRLTKWRRRLSKAIKEEGFTFKDRSKAETWTCCAVGERDHKCKGLITDDMTTHDNEFIQTRFQENIFYLGMKFAQAIREDNFTEVKKIIEQIEALEVKEFYN